LVPIFEREWKKADLLKDFISINQKVREEDCIKDGKTNSEYKPSSPIRPIKMMIRYVDRVSG
jgi:hypothetical protein